MVFRILVAVLTIVLLTAALFTFYNFAGSPTDENLFSDLPGHLAFRSTDSALVGMWGPLGGAKEADGRGVRDTVRTGDLLVLLNGQGVSSLQKLRSFLSARAADSVVNLWVLRPSTRTACTFHVTGATLRDSQFVEISRGALVIAVTKGGASDRAGMRMGDIIVRINGDAFANAQEGDVLLRRAQSGHVIIYDVLRDLVPIPLPVTLARFGFPLSLLILSISGLVFLGTGAFIGLKRPGITAARLLSLGDITLGFVIAIIGIRREPDVNPFIAARWVAMVVSLCFGMAFLWHGSLHFPSELKRALDRRWLVWVAYGVATLLAAGIIALGAAGLLKGNVELLALAGAFLVLFAVGAVARLVFRGGVDAAARERRKIIKVTGISVSILNILAVVALAVTNNFDQVGFIGIPLLLVPLATFYTIGRYRLLGMNLRIKRTIQYVLTSILWGVLVLSAGISVLTYFLGVPLHLPQITVHGLSIEVTDAALLPGQANEMERLLYLCVGLVAWVAISRVRRLGQGEIDKAFDRTQYDYRLALAEISAVLSTNLSMKALGKGIVTKLVELMKLRRAAVFFFKDEKICCCREAEGVRIGEWNEFCVDQESLIAMVAGRAAGPIGGDALPQSLREEFRRYQFEHIIPVRSKEKLIAVLVLGEKLSEAPFTAEDIDFLASVALQASVAIENAFLYEELAEQERLKQELEIARRIQLASLPQSTPAVPGLDIAGRSLPAFEVGGDFFDYLPCSDGRVTVIVGDVSGKGTSAALYMSKMQGVLRSLHAFVDSPRELLLRANSLLAQGMEKSSYVTVLGAQFDPTSHTVHVARAGHLPIFRYNAQERTLNAYIPKGLGLALDQTEKFAKELEQQTYPCAVNDVFVLVSDGITESMNPEGDEYGNARIEQVLHTYAHACANEIRDRLFESVRAFAGTAEQHDDQTVVVVKIV